MYAFGHVEAASDHTTMSYIDILLFSVAKLHQGKYSSSKESPSFQFAGSNTVFNTQSYSAFWLQCIIDNELPKQQIRHFTLALKVPSGAGMQKLLTPNWASFFTNLVWNQSPQCVSWKSYETGYCVSLQLHSSWFYKLTRSHRVPIRSRSLGGMGSQLNIMNLALIHVNSFSTDYLMNPQIIDLIPSSWSLKSLKLYVIAELFLVSSSFRIDMHHILVNNSLSLKVILHYLSF